MHITKVKHIEGDIELLKADLQEALGLQNGKDVVINQLTRHIIVKVCPELEHGGIAVG
jgi:large subunit ribosomal protein L49